MNFSFLFKKNSWTPGWGEISLSTLLIALLSGMLLIPFFNPGPDSFKSISEFINYNTLTHFLHSLHSYSGDLFLIAGFLHTFEYIYKKSYQTYPLKSWFLLILLSAISLMSVFTGFLSIGSWESISAVSIVNGILAQLWIVGSSLSVFLFPQGHSQTIYMHHISTFTILGIILIYIHIRRIKAENYAFYYTLFLLALFSIIFPEGVGFPPQTTLDVVKGPWYFIGFQEMLGWLPVWTAGILFPIIVFLFLTLLPFAKESGKGILYGFLLVFFFYFIESFIGYFLRGDEWQLLFR